MEFKELYKGSISDAEDMVNEYWDSIDILTKCIDSRNDKNYVFYDGPIYANAKPGLHHVFAKTIKDAFCKYKTMNGYKVKRKIGLDTHGLPIEVNVEKKLGFKNKGDIEKFGIENFCRECNLATATNIDEINKVTKVMGQFIDMNNPYITCTNDYIESEWWALKEIDKKGLLYYGNKVLPYCPRCGTELSANEVSQGYKEVSVNTVIVPFKVVGKDEYFLVWTTTPWTLMANVALCVNPDLTYVKVKSMGYTFIVGKSLVNKVLGEDIEVISEFKGSELEGISYEQLLPFMEVDKKAFYVTVDNYVTDSDGTGIVHIAPAFGEDDNKVGKKYNLPTLNPVGKDGCYNVGPWIGRDVVDPELEIEIIKYLKENDKLFKKIKMVHEYPHCWRCNHHLIYYAKPAWYIETTKVKDQIIEANKHVNWYPDYVGEKRFANWLENMVDWGISRNRYWGCPLPIWTCSCGHKHVVGSLDELQSMVVEDVDVKKIELHRPYVDQLHLKCPKCSSLMTRVLDVVDVWFDSGVMPYAQFHYPFENKELFKEQFPADFIAEGVDQTRGWFYSLIVISTILSGVSSYKNVVVNDMMLDKFGKKMSKSTGNIIEPIEIMRKYGADTIRFTMLYTSPVWTPLKFNEDIVKEVYSKFTSTFKNTYSFFQMYANADHIDPREYNIEVEDRELIDKWLLSKLNRLVKNVSNAYLEYDLNKVTKYLVDFLNDDLSNWYIRSCRRRFWDSEMSISKKAVYQTTYEVLSTLCRLSAPIVPFMSEEVYRNLTGEESVHLAEFPKVNEKLIKIDVEKQMDMVRDVCSLGRNAREEASIKVRQPISNIYLPMDTKDIIGDLVSVIKEELNVKEILFKEDMSQYMDYIIKPNFKEVGKVLGSKIKLFQEELSKFSREDIEEVKNNNKTIILDGEEFNITSDMVIISIKQKEGFEGAGNDRVSVVLDTHLTPELILEGLAREFVRTVQSLRKEADFVITDHINVYYNGDSDIDEMFDKYKDYIMGEVLGDKLIKDTSLSDKYELNSFSAFIKVERV